MDLQIAVLGTLEQDLSEGIGFMFLICTQSQKSPRDSFPLQNETTSEVYVGDFGLHNSRLHKCHHNRTPWNTK